MIRNGKRLLAAAPLSPMLDHKVKEHGVSHGLAEVGYDIRIKQEVTFVPSGTSHKLPVYGYLNPNRNHVSVYEDDDNNELCVGNFTLASSFEQFHMPHDLVGLVKDKSTWARKGLSVFNTVIEPGWKGWLTLELVYHGQQVLHIPAGCGIAQVIFEVLEEEATYNGKYQNQENRPVAAIYEVQEDFHP